jgi:hypothetical protein
MVPERLNLQKIDSVINTETGNLKILRGGLPYIRKYLLEEVNRDAIILIPAALVIMLMVLKAAWEPGTAYFCHSELFLSQLP